MLKILKKLLPVLILILLVNQLSAQDIILMRTGDEIKAKVLEINEQVVKYKKEDNPDGPVFSILKSNVMMIKYANGTKDVFQVQPSEPIPNQNAVSPFGQVPKKSNSKYLNISQLGISFGSGNLSFGSYEYNNDSKIISLSNISAYKANDYFSIGAGIGLDYYFEDGDHAILLPLFLDVRANVVAAKASPVFYFDIGHSFNIEDGDYIKGLMMEPGFGFSVPTDDVAFTFSLGYHIQKSSYYNYNYYNPYPTAPTKESVTYKFISIRLGIAF